jgi:hypothetical protein
MRLPGSGRAPRQTCAERPRPAIRGGLERIALAYPRPSPFRGQRMSARLPFPGGRKSFRSICRRYAFDKSLKTKTLVAMPTGVLLSPEGNAPSEMNSKGLRQSDSRVITKGGTRGGLTRGLLLDDLESGLVHDRFVCRTIWGLLTKMQRRRRSTSPQSIYTGCGGLRQDHALDVASPSCLTDRQWKVIWENRAPKDFFNPLPAPSIPTHTTSAYARRKRYRSSPSAHPSTESAARSPGSSPCPRICPGTRVNRSQT